MIEEKIYASNNVDDVVDCIQERVEKGETLFILFPFYFPSLGLNTEYDVIGKTENQLLIAEKLKKRNIDSIRVNETSFFTFFPGSISEKERQDIENEAMRIALWYDLID